jgi:hypothetical protein
MEYCAKMYYKTWTNYKMMHEHNKQQNNYCIFLYITRTYCITRTQNFFDIPFDV